MDKATFAAGCFWGVEVAFRRVPGVTITRVGYTGGDKDNPSADDHRGHAEAVEVIFDPGRTSYRNILEFFFVIYFFFSR